MLLIHGWGLHGGAWSAVPAALARTHRVHVVDLPGHGRSAGDGSWDLPTLADWLLDVVPPRSTWVGWSLGGFVALAAARRRPEGVGRLVLVGTTPRFVRGPDWPCGVAPEVLDEFASTLERDYRATMTRFLSLHLGEGAAERAALRRLRAEVFRYGEPGMAALRSGLDILKAADLRADLPAIEVPTRVVQGGCDRLAPPAAGAYLVRMLPRAEQYSFALAGHAPFLSEPEAFARLCREASRV